MTFKVLVADQEIDSLLAIKEAINREDIEVVSVQDAAQALEKATSDDYDLVIMDLDLEVMDSTEALRIIHMSEPDLPILIIAGACDEDLKANALKAGANLIASKPIRTTELFADIKKLLGIKP